MKARTKGLDCSCIKDPLSSFHKSQKACPSVFQSSIKMAQTTPVATTKVFVGNLAFKTKENELADAFGASVKVMGAKIITRRGRSLGYGFIEVGNEQDAQKAVQAMDKKDVDGRQINVEVARPREEGQEQQQGEQQERRGGAPRGRGGRGRGTRGSPRGAFRGGFRRRFPEGEDQGEQQEERPRGRGGFRGRGRGSRGGFRGGKTGAVQPGQPDTRTESKTSLFVANLPFSLDDAAFGKIFTDAGLKFKAAHVVTKRNGRSKGFGFVEFETNEDQQKALQTLNGKQVEGREITLKVALTDNRENANDNTQTEKKDEGKN